MNRDRKILARSRLLFELLEPPLLLISSTPNITGLRPVATKPEGFRGQVIYLDFGGETGVMYDDQVKMEHIEALRFRSPRPLASAFRCLTSTRRRRRVMSGPLGWRAGLGFGIGSHRTSISTHFRNATTEASAARRPGTFGPWGRPSCCDPRCGELRVQ